MISYTGLISETLSSHSKKIIKNDNDEIITFYVSKYAETSYLDSSIINEDNTITINKNAIKINPILTSNEQLNFFDIKRIKQAVSSWSCRGAGRDPGL